MTDRPALLVAGIALLAAWLGASLLVATVVAPAAFAVLPSRTLAGALVGRVLPVLFWSGMLVALLLSFVLRALPWRGLTGGSLAALAIACAAAQLVVAPRIEHVRAAIGGPVEALDPADPRRQAFGRLHGFSVLWLGAGTLAALAAVMFIARAIPARSIPPR